MHEPHLLLDEPYPGFDWETYQRFWQLADSLRDSGAMIVKGLACSDSHPATALVKSLASSEASHFSGRGTSFTRLENDPSLLYCSWHVTRVTWAARSDTFAHSFVRPVVRVA